MKNTKNEIRKERTHLFSPGINIAISFYIQENLCMDTLTRQLDIMRYFPAVWRLKRTDRYFMNIPEIADILFKF